jgi:hypothetical protein
MVSDETKEIIVEKFTEIVNKPLTERGMRSAFQRTAQKYLKNMEWRDEGVDLPYLEELWAQILEESEQKGDTEVKAFERQFNSKIKPFFKYNNKSLNLSDLFDTNFDAEAVTLNPNKIEGDWDEVKSDLDAWIRQQVGAEKIPEKAEKNLMLILEVVDDQIAREISDEELKTIELLPQELVKGIRNIRLTANREIMYKYWEKISKYHEELQDAIRNLQIEVRDGGESPVKDLILQLPGDIPNYIQEVPSKSFPMMKIGQRLMDWVATMLIAYEEEHRVKGPQLPKQSRNYPNLTTASKRRRGAPKTTFTEPIGERDKKHAKGFFHRETERQPHHKLTQDELNEATAELEFVDPILFDSLQDGLPLAVKTHDLNDAEEFINNVSIMLQKRGLTDMERGLKTKLARIKKEAIKTDPGDKYYIPMTNWVMDNYPELGDNVAQVEKKTSTFFKLLGDIKLEIKGQERMQMDVSYPPAGKEAGAKTPLSASPAKPGDWGKKPKGPGLKRLRAHGGREAVERTDFGSEDVADKLTELMEIVDKYYFVPILGKSSLFIDRELPNFSDDLEGNYNFNTLAMAFSNNPVAKKSAGIGSRLEANFNLEDLEIIALNLKAEITSEKEPDTNVYVKVLTRLAKSLTEWSEEKERSGQFCADQLHRYLMGKEEENTINEYQINGDNAKVLYDGWLGKKSDEDGEEDSIAGSDSIILDLREWLEGDRFNSLIKQFEDMGVNVTKYNNAKDTILESTDQDTLNNIPELLEKMLEVHDVIRKMKGQDIIYDKLSINNIDAMDYVITKMENKHKLDITANDVLNIVYSDKSFKNISTNYGFSENIVYEIKGMFR